MSEEIRGILEEALRALESYAVAVDGELGSCRSLEELYADADEDDVMLKIKALLGKE